MKRVVYSHKVWRVLNALVVLLSLGTIASAQITPMPFNKAQEWFAYSADHKVKGKWALHFDGGWRQLEDANWNQFLVRPGVNYQLSSNVQLSAAYGYFNTHPGGLSWQPGSAPEHRLQEQLQMQQTVGKLGLKHRYRFDQRFLGSGWAEGQERTWKLQHRARYMLRTDIPLRKGKGERTTMYLGLYNEFFLRFGHAGQSAFDQNRIYAGLGFRPAQKVGFEVGAFNQRFQPMSGGRMENNVVFLMCLSNQVPLSELFRRKASVAKRNERSIERENRQGQ